MYNCIPKQTNGAKIMKTLTKTITTFEVLEYMIDYSFKNDYEFISRLILRKKIEKKITLDELGILVSKMSKRF